MSLIALIGQGYMAKAHAAAYAALGLGDRIAYICTPRPGAPLEDAPQATFRTDLENVLADPEVTIVSVCTPTTTHAAITVAALAAGKNVLLEKPLALNLDEAEQIAEAARTSSGIVMIAQVVRFFPGYEAVHSAVTEGAVGKPLAVRAKRLSLRPDWAEWWLDPAESGGVLVDFAVHDFDQMNLHLGSPTKVYTVGNGTYGPFETTIHYAGGGIGQVLSHADLPAGAPFTSAIEVVGTEGMVDYTLLAGSAIEDGTGSDAIPGTNMVRAATDSRRWTSEISGEDPYTRQAAYFLKCIEDGVQPEKSSVESALLALRVSLAALKSLQTGEAVLLTGEGEVGSGGSSV